MLPRSRRDHSVVFEVTTDDGKVAGYVEEWRTRGASATFYRATGLHPETGKECRLESSTNLDERVATVLDFYTDPERYAHHWAHRYSGTVDDPNRVVHGPEGRGPKR
jgi:hypothetical protein